MFYAAGLRRCCARSFILNRRLASSSMSQSLKNISLQRNAALSTITRSDFELPKPVLPSQDYDTDKYELTENPNPNRSSLHVANIPDDTTDEEFRQAFSEIPGIVKTELVFNSGPMRDYKNTSNRGFGFLHFEDETKAKSAMLELGLSPVILQGHKTEVKRSNSRLSTRNGPSHVIKISKLPLDLQFLEVSQLLRERCPYFKSLRFMAGEPDNFLGVASIVFEDTMTAERAKDRLDGMTLGGMIIREHNISFGRPLYDYGPTDTLMLLGTPVSADAAYDFRRLLDTFDCIQRYKLMRDRVTNVFKGYSTINCGSVDNAWMMLEWFNREYPHYRVAFVKSGREYEEERKRKLAAGEITRSGRPTSGPEISDEIPTDKISQKPGIY